MSNQFAGEDQLIVPAQDVIDLDHDGLDDVEGHGLREVAAGLGAAAVLAGGGGAAIASASNLGSLPNVHPSGTISVAVSDPIGTADRATDQGLEAAREARDGAVDTATTTASRSVTTASTTAANTERSALNTAAGALGTVKQDVAAAEALADNLGDYATRTASTTVRNAPATAAGAISNAGHTASGALHSTDQAVTGATRTAAGTVQDADRKVATVLSVTTSTAKGNVNTVTATLKALNAGVGVDVGKATGWLTIKAGDLILAQTQVSGSTVSATFTTPAGQNGITVTYTGDEVFAPTMRSITL